MGESITNEFQEYINETLDLKDVDLMTYSPLVLAYIGDCVYDLVIKSMIINRGNNNQASA